MQRIKEIDFLRAYAVLAVVVLHIDLLLFPGFSIKSHCHLDGGVDLFFVISGFVVSEALERLRQKGLKGVSLYVTFLMRRLKRLWIPAAFWLTYCLGASLMFYESPWWPSCPEIFYKVLSGFFYVYNFEEINNHSMLGYFWTLSVEWQFYVVLPILMLFPRIYVVVLLAALLVVGVFYRLGGESWWMFRCDGIYVGILVWELHDKRYLRNIGSTFLRFRAVQIITTLLLLSVAMWWVVFLIVSYRFYYLDVSVCCLAGGALVALAGCDKGYTSLGFEGLLNWIGLRSYSIYLCHIPVILTYFSVMSYVPIPVRLWWFLPLILGTIFLVSDLSYRYLEGLNQRPRRKIFVESALDKVKPEGLAAE